MASPTGQRLAKSQTSTKISAANGYLLSFEDFAAKRNFNGSNSTTSTCSDLDISFSTLSAASSSASNASDQQIPESVCSDEVATPRSEILIRMPAGATPIDQTVVVAPAGSVDNLELSSGSVSKARSFCQKAFAECNLDNMDDELADLTKDLEALRANMANSKRAIRA